MVRTIRPKKNFRVGLVWAGNPEHKNDHNQSIDIDLLQSLAGIDGVSSTAFKSDREPTSQVFSEKT